MAHMSAGSALDGTHTLFLHDCACHLTGNLDPYERGFNNPEQTHLRNEFVESQGSVELCLGLIQLVNFTNPAWPRRSVLVQYMQELYHKTASVCVYVFV